MCPASPWALRKQPKTPDKPTCHLHPLINHFWSLWHGKFTVREGNIMRTSIHRTILGPNPPEARATSPNASPRVRVANGMEWYILAIWESFQETPPSKTCWDNVGSGSPKEEWLGLLAKTSFRGFANGGSTELRRSCPVFPALSFPCYYRWGYPRLPFIIVYII